MQIYISNICRYTIWCKLEKWLKVALDMQMHWFKVGISVKWCFSRGGVKSRFRARAGMVNDQYKNSEPLLWNEILITWNNKGDWFKKNMSVRMFMFRNGSTSDYVDLAPGIRRGRLTMKLTIACVRVLIKECFIISMTLCDRQTSRESIFCIGM